MDQLVLGDGSYIPSGAGTLQERIDRHGGSVVAGFCGITDRDFESFHTLLSPDDDSAPAEDWDPEVFTSWIQGMVEREGVAEVLVTLRSGKAADKPKGKEREKVVRFDTSASGSSSSRTSALASRTSPGNSMSQPDPQIPASPSNEPAFRYQSSIGARFDL